MESEEKLKVGHVNGKPGNVIKWHERFKPGNVLDVEHVKGQRCPIYHMTIFGKHQLYRNFLKTQLLSSGKEFTPILISKKILLC